ncbi:MAG: HAD hydrolase-like protein [Actinobacteria bacterium]|nr:HAD hydrolase-like protein [Actinomycetota bacterium]
MLFDLDGTLTDPEEGIVGSFRHALASVGHPVADDVDLRWMIGPAIRDNFTRHGLPEELHHEAVLAYRARHVEVGLFQASLIVGVIEVLDALLADGVALALATAKPVEQAITTLEHFEIADRFAVVAGGVADGQPRSKAAIVADGLAQLGAPDPARVAMVGDRRHDVEGGRENGCTTVAVTWGFAEEGELAAVGPDHLVHTPAELLEVLRSLG